MSPTTVYLIFSLVPSALCASESHWLHVADSLTRRDGAHAKIVDSLETASLHSGSKANADSDRHTYGDQVHEKANSIVRKKDAAVSEAIKEMSTSEQTAPDAAGEADDSTHSINHAREPSMLADNKASARRHSMAREQLTQKHHTQHSSTIKHHAKHSRNMARKYPQHAGKDQRNVMEVLPSGEVESLRGADILDDTPSAQTVEESQKLFAEMLQPTIAPTAVAAIAPTAVAVATAQPSAVAVTGPPAAAAVPALPVAATGPPVAAAAPASPVVVTAPAVGYMPAAGYVPTQAQQVQGQPMATQAQQVQGQPVAGTPGAAAPATANTDESSTGGVLIACFVLLILLVVILIAVCGLSRVIALRKRQESPGVASQRHSMLDFNHGASADDRPATRTNRGSFAARRMEKKNSLVARPNSQAAATKGDLSQKSAVDSDVGHDSLHMAATASVPLAEAAPKRLSRYSLIKKNRDRTTESCKDSAREPFCSRNDGEGMTQTNSIPVHSTNSSSKIPERTDETPEEVGHAF